MYQASKQDHFLLITFLYIVKVMKAHLKLVQYNIYTIRYNITGSSIAAMCVLPLSCHYDTNLLLIDTDLP